MVYLCELFEQIQPLQCFNCHKWNHVAQKCPNKDKPVCCKCSGEHRSKECKSVTRTCVNRKGIHSASYGGCPEMKKQADLVLKKLEEKEKKNNIQRIIRHVNPSISYSSAVQQNETKRDDMISTELSNIKQSIENLNNNLHEQLNKKIDEQSRKTDDLIKKTESFLNDIENMKASIIKEVKKAIDDEIKKCIKTQIDNALKSMGKAMIEMVHVNASNKL